MTDRSLQPLSPSPKTLAVHERPAVSGTNTGFEKILAKAKPPRQEVSSEDTYLKKPENLETKKEAVPDTSHTNEDDSDVSASSVTPETKSKRSQRSTQQEETGQRREEETATEPSSEKQLEEPPEKLQKGDELVLSEVILVQTQQDDPTKVVESSTEVQLLKTPENAEATTAIETENRLAENVTIEEGAKELVNEIPDDSTTNQASRSEVKTKNDLQSKVAIQQTSNNVNDESKESKFDKERNKERNQQQIVDRNVHAEQQRLTEENVSPSKENKGQAVSASVSAVKNSQAKLRPKLKNGDAKNQQEPSTSEVGTNGRVAETQFIEILSKEAAIPKNTLDAALPVSSERIEKKQSPSNRPASKLLEGAFANKLMHSGKQATGEGNEKSQVESMRINPARFLQRVTKAFRLAADQGTTIRIRLSPPELGAMRVELVVRNGGIVAKIETHTHTARTALLDNLPQLRERLAEQKIQVEQFDVNVRDETPQHQQENAADAQQRQRDAEVRNQNNSRDRLQTKDQGIAAQSKPNARPRGDEALNMVV